MGHLINILNKIQDACNRTGLGQFLTEKLPTVNERLNTFRETTLSETNKTLETLLVSFIIQSWTNVRLHSNIFYTAILILLRRLRLCKYI